MKKSSEQICVSVKKLWRSILTSRVIHGLAEVNRGRSWLTKIVWFVLIGLCLWRCTSAISTLFGVIVGGDSKVQMSTTHADAQPNIFFCPYRIPLSAVTAAGYSEDMLHLLNSVIQLPHDGKTETVYDKSIAMAAKTRHKSLILQEVLREIGDKHKILLDMSARADRYVLIPLTVVNEVILVPTGYCFALQAQIKEDDNGSVSSLGTQWSRFYVDIKNISISEESGGTFLHVSSRRNNLPPAPVLTFHKAYIAMDIESQEFHFRRTEVRPCLNKPDDAHSLDCYYRCLQWICADIGLVYNVNANQSLEHIMSGNELKKCQRRVSSNTFPCKMFCTSDCDGILYKATLRVNPLEDAQTALSMKIMQRNVDGTTVMHETVPIQMMEFVGYAGGMLGLYLGFSFLAFIQRIWRTLWGKVCLKTKERFRSKSTPCLRGFYRAFPWVLLLSIMFALFYPQVFSAYFQKRTSGLISVGTSTRHAKIALHTMWQDESKLRSLLPVPDGFWEDEDARWANGNTTVPFMCEYMQALINGDPFPKTFPTTEPWFVRYTQYLGSIVGASDIVRTKGVMHLLNNIVFDPKHIVYDVTDGRNNSVPHNLNVRRTFYGYFFEVDIDYDNVTKFTSGVGPVTIHTRRQSMDLKCRSTQPDFKTIILGSDFKNRNAKTDLMGMPIGNDMLIEILPSTVKLMEKPNRGCDHSYLDGTTCANDCLDYEVPCSQIGPCRGGILAQTKDPMFTNMSVICHKMLHGMQNCVLNRAILAKANWVGCQAKCNIQCERTIFRMRMYARNAKSDTVQLIDIKHKPGSESLDVTEFYDYDFVLFLTTLAGLWSLLFGHSFVSVFPLLFKAREVYQAKAVLDKVRKKSSAGSTMGDQSRKASKKSNAGNKAAAADGNALVGKKSYVLRQDQIWLPIGNSPTKGSDESQKLGPSSKVTRYVIPPS